MTSFQELAPLLWNSFGTITVLLQVSYVSYIIYYLAVGFMCLSLANFFLLNIVWIFTTCYETRFNEKIIVHVSYFYWMKNCHSIIGEKHTGSVGEKFSFCNWLLSRKFATNLYLCVSNFYFSMRKQHYFHN